MLLAVPFSRKLNSAGKCWSSRDPSGCSQGQEPWQGGNRQEEEGGHCQERGSGAGIGAVCSPEHLTTWNSQSCPSWSRDGPVVLG